jgi:hypothetical protein
VVGIFILMYLFRKRIEPYLTKLCIYWWQLSFECQWQMLYCKNPDYILTSEVRKWQMAENIVSTNLQRINLELIWEFGKPLPS